MIDSSPRPLAQRRLESLVHGLHTRMSGSLQQTAAQVDGLNEELRGFERAHESDLQELEQQASEMQDAATTDWDKANHEVWDVAELQTYKAIYDTAEKEEQLRKRAKLDIDNATDEAKKRIAEIEKRFMSAKNVPIKRLNNFRAAHKTAQEDAQNVEQSAENAVTQRSLRLPIVELREIEIGSYSSSSDAFQAMKARLEDARQACDRLANNRLARFFESFWWWGFCGILFIGLAAGLTLTQVADMVTSLMIGAGATVVFIILGFLAIRPWLKSSAKREFPRVKELVAQTLAIGQAAEELAVHENDQELKRLAAKRDERFEQAKSWRDQQVVEITKSLQSNLDKLHQHAERQKLSARDNLTHGIEQTADRFGSRMSDEAAIIDGKREGLARLLSGRQTELRGKIDELNRGGALRMQIATQKAIQVVTRSRRWCDNHFPSWEEFDGTPQAWPETVQEPILPIGSLRMDTLLPEKSKRDLGLTQLEAPFLFSPLQDGYLAIRGDAGSSSVKYLMRNLLMRALTTLPPGKTQVCVIDPQGLGQDFGWLMHLGDFDAQLVSHRVWTQPGHIVKQLESLALSAEDFIQQSLRNQYENIVQYNRDAGALAEPFRILVWNGFPTGTDDQSWKSLRSILDTGARCGIISIFVIDENGSWPSPDHQQAFESRGLHVTQSDSGFTVAGPRVSELSLELHDHASEEKAQQIVQDLGRRALLASRVEVPLAKMVPSTEEKWQGDSSPSLEIPIGQSGVGRTHALKLGVGTAQHAIIAGKTGSGKSSLLHALITSALLKYSPSALRLVLLDFKKGVEFQVYSDAAVPHADIIGIESHREFGLSALQYVDECMQRRGEQFRSAGVQDIASWNALRPDEPMPRMLVVVDEFQELFVEDDKLSGQASLILDRIVRQGRSFGVHAVLSSQTLAGAYSLPRTTLGQMAVRIALQCDASDAQIIFADDNPAASRLKHPGQAVYNDAGGRIEGNQPMQIGWLSKQQQQQWFADLPSGYANQDETTNLLGRTIVYDGNRAAGWSTDNAELAIEGAKRDVNPDAIWCVTGESVAINPAVAFPLTRQAGRNAIVVGGDDAQAAAVMDVVATSLVRDAGNREQCAAVHLVQGAKPTDAKALLLAERWGKLPCELSVSDTRGASDAILAIHATLQKRMEQEEGGEVDSQPMLLTLSQLGRIRDLKKDDDFGMSDFGESELKADKALEEILRDGPSYGIYTLIWAESYSTVNRWLSRSALREIEIRLLMQMSGNDSTNLVDSVAASRLGDHVMLLYDEATGQEQRFRPFDVESLDELAGWANS